VSFIINTCCQNDEIDIILESEHHDIPVDNDEPPSSAGLLSETENENHFENLTFVRDDRGDIGFEQHHTTGV
jgi:hypothetical protein